MLYLWWQVSVGLENIADIIADFENALKLVPRT